MKNIAILGRPNVGKSTLFNRFAGRRKSIVDPTAGVTRDISIAKTYIDDIAFNVFDTGGLLDMSEDVLNEKVREKALKTATDEADLLLFVVDAHQTHPDDRHFINTIRKLNKNKEYLLYCASGGRSSAVSQYMLKKGFKNLYNLVNAGYIELSIALENSK